MSDVSSDKIKELLSDPNNLEKIAALVGSMSGGGLSGLLAGTAQTPPSAQNPSVEPEATSAGALPESVSDPPPVGDDSKAVFSPLSGVPPVAPSALFSGASGDKRIALLKAIKPYVSDAKKERVDGLVRAISVAGLLNNYKNGLFG